MRASNENNRSCSNHFLAALLRSMPPLSLRRSCSGAFLATVLRPRAPLPRPWCFPGYTYSMQGTTTCNGSAAGPRIRVKAEMINDFVRSAKLHNKIYTCVLYEAGGVSLIQLSSMTAAQLRRGHGASISMMSYRLTNNASYLISLTCLGGQSY